MKRIEMQLGVWVGVGVGVGLMLAATASLAQTVIANPNPMYTSTDIGSADGFALLDISEPGTNASGQSVGSFAADDGTQHCYRMDANGNFDDLGTLGGAFCFAYGINASGQVVGESTIDAGPHHHAFRTGPNMPINPATDDLGTLLGSNSVGEAINDLGQVVGVSDNRAFRTGPNMPINPATDNLGPIGFSYGEAEAINNFGDVVGRYVPSNATRGFVYSDGPMQDLNFLIPSFNCCPGCVLPPGLDSQIIPLTAICLPPIRDAYAINDDGYILAVYEETNYLLTPVYAAAVQPPISPNRSSVFNHKRGDLPVKFTLMQSASTTCTLPSATISVARIAGKPLGSIDVIMYSTPADDGSSFGIDQTNCQYVYHLAASSLGVGRYQVNIDLNGIAVGHAIFALN